MNKDLMRTGDTGFIKFRFMYRPEYLKIGTTILFREGRTKGLGVVSKIFPEDKPITENLRVKTV
jgi:GTPase